MASAFNQVGTQEVLRGRSAKQMRQGSHDHPLDTGTDDGREQPRRLTDGVPDSGVHLVGGAGAGQLVI